MPNSDGSNAINCIPSADPPSESNGSVPLQNGIHGEDKDGCHANGETSPPGVNGIVREDVYTASEISATAPLTMKIIRKRTSDTEIVHDSSKKSKLITNNCVGGTRSPQTETLIESPKEAKGNGEEKAEKPENAAGNQNPEISSNGNLDEEKKDPTPPDCDASSSSSIIFVEADDAHSESANVNVKSLSKADEEKIEMKVEDVKDEIVEIKDDFSRSIKGEIVNFEEKPNSETAYKKVSAPTKSDGADTSFPVRESVLDAYNRHLKKAVTCSITSLHRITQSLSTHNNNWQTKYHQLHNRFLHLKVCTDKMVESAAKEGDKQCRSVEAQTEDDPSAPSTAANSTAPGTPNSLQRQPSTTSNGAKIAGPVPAVQNDIHPQLQSQATQLQAQLSGPGSSLMPPQHQPQIQQQQQPQPQSQQPQPQPQQQQQPPPPPPPPPPPQPQLQPQQQQFVIVSPNGGQATLPRARLLATIAAQSGANVIDLTEDDVTAAGMAQSLRNPGINVSPTRIGREGIVGDQRIRHPMPLPRMTSPVPTVPCKGLPPPSPYLTVSPTENGVCLKWNIPNLLPNVYSKLKRYRLFNYSKTPQSVFFSFQNPWKEIGSVDSMDLPMACTLTQIQSNSVYYFAIRPVDEYERLGIWSNTATIELAAVDS